MSTQNKFNAAAEAATRINAVLVAKGKNQSLLKELPQFNPDIGYEETNRTYFYIFDVKTFQENAKKILCYSDILESLKSQFKVECQLLSEEEIEVKQYSEVFKIKFISRKKDELLGCCIRYYSVLYYVQKQYDTMNQKIHPMLNLFKANSLLKIGPITPGQHYFQEKIFIGLDNAHPAFPLKLQITGPNNTFLEHIRKQTGALATIRGKGSGFLEPISGKEAWEPLHIHVMHVHKNGMETAKKLAQNLIETAQQKYLGFQQSTAMACGLPPMPTIPINNSFFGNMTMPPLVPPIYNSDLVNSSTTSTFSNSVLQPPSIGSLPSGELPQPMILSKDMLIPPPPPPSTSISTLSMIPTIYPLPANTNTNANIVISEHDIRKDEEKNGCKSDDLDRYSPSQLSNTSDSSAPEDLPPPIKTSKRKKGIKQNQDSAPVIHQNNKSTEKLPQVSDDVFKVPRIIPRRKNAKLKAKAPEKQSGALLNLTGYESPENE